MTRICAVVGCSHKTNKNTDKKFYSFPSVKDNHSRDLPYGIAQRSAWIKAIRRQDLTALKIRHGAVCSDHFISGKPATPGDTDNPDYAPSIKMGYVTCQVPGSNSLERFNRTKKRKLFEPLTTVKKQDITSTASEKSTLIEVVQDVVPERRSFMDKETQTDVDDFLLEELYKLREKVKNLSYNIDSFRDDRKKIKYFTGIPSFQSLLMIFSLIKPFIKVHSNSALQDKFSQFLLVLMKLRLNLDFRFLGYIFNISEHTASRIFHANLNIMYHRLSALIVWPHRDDLHNSMPECFKLHFGKKVAVIIDCFEVRCERSGNLHAQSSTWSNYKHYNTVKILIGITPVGTVSFISKAFGGRCSDKEITERSGILEKLIPGDVILADRGFLIQLMVASYQATAIIPAFLKGKKQLNPCEIQETRHIAEVRIHVERVIGLVRQKYTIIGGILPMCLLKKKRNGISVIDQILTVSCALVNLCPPIIN